MVKQGEEKKTDYPRITVFGKQAENCEKFLKKGRLVGIQGRLQTGSYTDKNGNTVYTTDVVADRVEFLEWGEKSEQKEQPKEEPKPKATPKETQEEFVPSGFTQIEDDIPF